MQIHYFYTDKVISSIHVKNILERYANENNGIKCWCYESLYSDFSKKFPSRFKNISHDDINNIIDSILRDEFYPKNVLVYEVPALIIKNDKHHDVYYVDTGEYTIADILKILELSDSGHVPPQEARMLETKKDNIPTNVLRKRQQRDKHRKYVSQMEKHFVKDGKLKTTSLKKGQ